MTSKGRKRNEEFCFGSDYNVQDCSWATHPRKIGQSNCASCMMFWQHPGDPGVSLLCLLVLRDFNILFCATSPFNGEARFFWDSVSFSI